MKSLTCNSVSGKTCDFEATGETDEEVMGKLKAHGAEVHPDLMEGIAEEEMAEAHKQMEEKMRQSITEK